MEAQAHHCVESFAHKIDKAIAVGGMDVQKWMPPRARRKPEPDVSGRTTTGMHCHRNSRP
jgi:hypothetical protein